MVPPEPPRALLGGIARVEALKVVVELAVSRLDELGQRCSSEIAVLGEWRAGRELSGRRHARQQVAGD
jgi:hypothetical protein